MPETFQACDVPWRIWPWGITLRHADTEVTPECSVEFGAHLPTPTPPNESIYVVVTFQLAGYASAKPRRDDETLTEVTGYAIEEPVDDDRLRAEWIRTGKCPYPGFYYSTDSRWLDTDRRAWAARQRTDRAPDEATHFLLDSRDGYVEIMAASYSWEAWPSDHSGGHDLGALPLMSGRWPDPNPAIE